MSLYGAMFAGVSGLSAQSNALGMISDNISNVNTVGYKGVNARFSTLVTKSATQTKHIPGGVSSSPFMNVARQGLLQASSSGTDLAVAGQGFFVVNEIAAPTGNVDFRFTRAGSFTPNQDGNLINAGGYFLQGYDLRSVTSPPASSSTFSSLSTVNVSNLSGTAAPTTTLSLSVNLPSTAAVSDAHSVTVQIFDSLGNAHDMALTFTKTGANAWSYASANPTLNGAATGTSAGAGTITFNGDGTPAVITTVTPFTVTGWTTGATNSSLTFDLGTVNSTDGATQFAGNFTISGINQDGDSYGIFSGVSISEAGVVTALFNNGARQDIYQLPLGMFRNPSGLEAKDGNTFVQTNNSGNFQLNLAQTGGAGAVSPASLEASTVDLAEEFTNMIVTQRAYSANAKIITTADDMLEELIRIKR